MSYEGKVQVLCSRGHLTTYGCHDESPKSCGHHNVSKGASCGCKFVWFHSVNETNGSEESDYAESFLKLEKETKCECCGTVLERTYKE